MEDVLELPIRSIHEKLVQKQISAKELVELCLGRIEQRDKELNAFITPTPELALKQTAEIDRKLKKGEDVPLLAGIPCSIKDAILVEGIPCTAGSAILKNYIAPYDATVTRKLKEQNAVIVGKTNMDEFGMGGSTENSAFGPTKNPYDPTRVAGGSSGGGAASIASSEALVALGEDTGGSIRLPASFCGVVGLKPTYGAVSRYGIIPLASSLDQIGPFARTVEDCEIVFEAIKGKDAFDSTSVEYEYKREEKLNLKKLRIGVPKEYFGKGLDPQVEEVIKNALQKFEDAGAHLEEIALPHATYALAVYYIINTSEASANLARYDGIRYGESAVKNQKSNVSLLDVYLKTRGENLGAEVKRRIMLGTYALSAGYYDAYYLKAQKIRALLKQDFEQAFQKVDVIMGPTSPFLPFKIGERIENPMSMYLVDIYTVPVNLAGLPGLSLPAGMSNNLPVGLQMIGNHFEENLLFETGKAFEKMVQ